MSLFSHSKRFRGETSDAPDDEDVLPRLQHLKELLDTHRRQGKGEKGHDKEKKGEKTTEKRMQSAA